MNKLWKKIHFLKVFNFFLNEFLSFKKIGVIYVLHFKKSLISLSILTNVIRLYDYFIIGGRGGGLTKSFCSGGFYPVLL